MEVGGQTAHGHHFGPLCPSEAGERISQKFMVRHPRIFRVKMPFDTKRFPVVQFLGNRFGNSDGLKP